ncbi:MAG: bifunctional diguanylate cyclase/phosphodiesterase [Pseudomonadota bacterium]
MAGKVRWWHGILARSLLAVLAVTVLVGIFSVFTVSRIVSERTHSQSLTRLGELLDTVESTASVACFVGDEQLAKEVAQGLLRNSEVQRAVIRVGERSLAVAERGAQKVGAGRTASPATSKPAVSRILHSPFNAQEVIGSISLDADWDAIDAWTRDNTYYTSMLLAGQIALVVAAAIAAIFFLVLRPIKETSDRLHHLDAAGGERLGMPKGHEKTEVGRLVDDINELTGQLVETLDQERGLRRQQEVDQRKYQDLFNNAGSGIFVADRLGCLDSYNRALIELTWLPKQTGNARRWVTDAHWQDPDQLLDMISASLDEPAGHEVLSDDFLLYGRRGDERWLHVTIVPLGDGSVQGTVTDVTQRKLEELSARQLAVTDSLTGFANRVGLHRLLADLKPGSEPFALIMVDLDGFKQINDALGFPVGDELLLGVAARLREALVGGDHVARIGSDEFALVLRGESDRQSIKLRIDHLAGRLAQPFDVQATEVRRALTVGASMGVAMFPRDGSDIHQLLRAAELALNSARTAGGCTHKFFDPALQAAAEHRRRLEDDLRAAVAARELQLAFQPIIDLQTGKVAGAEALLRWPHPQRGFVPPDIFVPLAEEIGLIGAIGLVVLDGACHHAALWRHHGLDIHVSVNVSARQIPDDLPPVVVLDILNRHGLAPEALVFEITEGVLMSSVTVAQSWIESLRAAGVRIYLDDFGTGYSSLSYLKRFPLDTVKIDKSFIRDLHADKSDYALVDAIITMARSLGLHVVAEGIEDEQQLEVLRNMGCGYGQGYYFARPIAAADFAAMVLRINSGKLGRLLDEELV